MHICDLTTLYIEGGEGGVNTYLTEKARYLAEHPTAFRHTIIVPGDRNTKRELHGSTVYTLRSPRFFYNPHHRIMINRRLIRQLLVESKPDVVEVDCIYFLGRWAAAAMGKRRVPLVGFYHTHLPSLYTKPLTHRFGPCIARHSEAWAWSYMAYCMKPLDKIFVAASDIYARLIERIDKKAEHVPLGVNLDLFQPRALEPLRRRPVILYVGRLSQEKDLDVLFEAFRRLNRGGEYQLHIVGDGPLRVHTERFVRATPGTVYVGPIPYGKSLAAHYNGADVLVSPSRNETFGLTILEALASGLPVVAMDQGGPSSLLHTGVGALAVPGDASDFAGKIAHVLASRMSAARCREHAKQHFSWDKTFAKLLDIYDNLHRRVSPLVREER